MKTRMQPIGNAWSKLPRLVRDLSNTTGKQIELEMTGAETELDRTVLDAIKDPLTHMVRNSADHGIETPAVRRAAGKPERGRVKLNAFHEGGHVVISIDDDGAGISIEKVRHKAIANGLVSDRDAGKLSDKEVLNFIFLPGFSTAEKVTSVSGRGVGMDVVRTQIERIGGTVELSSRAGQGTTIRIRIPLTLAIISALVVESGGQSFAIPQLGVVELVRLPAEERHKIERIHNNEVFRLRKRLLPLVYLDRVLGLADAEQSKDQDVNIVVVQVGEEQFGLIVAEVFDTEEIVVKPMGQLLKNINVYQGTTILGDGRVIMILDVGGIAAKVGGLSNTSSSDRESQQRDQEADGGQLTTLLLFDGGDNASMAVPLSLVARLEEFPRKAIEHSGDRMLTQYRGDLLPLLPLHGMRDENPPDPQPVIVFSEGKHSMGLLVKHIQDIREEQFLIRMQSQRPGVLGTAIVNGRATDIIDTQHYVTQANPEWFHTHHDLHSIRVLVVDDSIFFRQLVTTTLETEGYRVDALDGPLRAIQRLERGEKFDVIVSDIDMPEMDGCQFAEHLKTRGLVTAPLIALTSMTGTGQEARILRAGFARYLVKFNAKQLLNAIEELHAASKRGALQETSA
jgi:two-component system, chemotaxis family, sensor kinase CheA